MAAMELQGQGLVQLGELVLAFVLSALVGFERELRQKSAGLRTTTLVGVASALFMLISKYGFTDILAQGRVVLDPSRVAAQVVSGIGFIGGGVIFMRRDVVRGLTTAASVWLTAALGMACGAGLPILALATTAGHFVIMLGFPVLTRRARRNQRSQSTLQIVYADGRGLLRDILVLCTELRFAIDKVELQGTVHTEDGIETESGGVTEGLDPERHRTGLAHPAGARRVALRMQVRGKRPVSHLIVRLGAVDGISEVGLADDPDVD